MTLNGFVGTVPAPTKGTFTGYDMTGATITTDAEGETCLLYTSPRGAGPKSFPAPP